MADHGSLLKMSVNSKFTSNSFCYTIYVAICATYACLYTCTGMHVYMHIWMYACMCRGVASPSVIIIIITEQTAQLVCPGRII